MDEILVYADDLLVLSDVITIISKSVRTIQIWSENNGMMLNKQKSDLIGFKGRRQRNSLLKLRELFEGIPVVDQYRYLGLTLNSKLTLKDQISFISRKSAYIRYKLSSIINNSTLELRKKFWQMFIRPLTEFTIPLYNHEESLTQKQTVLKTIR
jgi:hypothetical protein